VSGFSAAAGGKAASLIEKETAGFVKKKRNGFLS
jgi:hypothetical protein